MSKYALDAAKLLLQVQTELTALLPNDDDDRSKPKNTHRRPPTTAEVQALAILREHICVACDHVGRHLNQERRTLHCDDQTSSTTLAEAVAQWSAQPKQERPQSTDTTCYFPTKTASDTLLFRLIVILQLCLERTTTLQTTHVWYPAAQQDSSWSVANNVCTWASVVSVSIMMMTPRRMNHRQRMGILFLAGTAMAYRIRRMGASWWMSRKLLHSVRAVEHWNTRWVDYLTYPEATRQTRHSTTEPSVVVDESSSSTTRPPPPSPTSRMQSYQSALQLTEGEIRFFLLKRFMDVFYASVGAASRMGNAKDWQLQLATAAAATYYSLTGASTQAAQVVSTSKSARQLLEKAWGMVSLPTVKSLSLHASRLVKGAAVVDRIHIGGVSCFILSREPIPELAAELKQQKRRLGGGGTKAMMHRLSTIDERREHKHQSTSSFSQSFAKGDYRQRDIILHLTGGGFFAHIIASDLPYLLDWSSATGAVVVCPEYSLLPENKFPAALQDVECVYQNLIDPGIACTLGFEVERLIISGESVGGNLATALCVKLEMDARNQSRTGSDESVHELMSDEETEFDQNSVGEDSASHATLPHAMLLSCPVLDLAGGSQSLDPSYGEDSDPVLSTGLVSAISDAYVPKGIRKNISLISPLYAADDILERFPPTLIFGSSHDPVLDDSVVLNQRLNTLGVSSDLRAVENLPHAYLGLGTAGFPEARQVQRQIEEWLIEQLQSP